MNEMQKFLHDKYVTETFRMHAVLMGVATAAIAFTFHETADKPWSQPLAIQLVAVVLWAISFVCGISFSKNMVIAIKSNIGLIAAKAINYQGGERISTEGANKANSRASIAYRIQQYALFLGAISYLLGHILEVTGCRLFAWNCFINMQFSA